MQPLFDDLELPNLKIRLFSDEEKEEAQFKFYRAVGFPHRNLSPGECMRELEILANLPKEKLIHTVAGYQVADTFHRHRIEASANGMHSPMSSFNDDKRLRKAIRLSIKYTDTGLVSPTGLLSLVNGTQACSNFRPGFAAYIYKMFCKPNSTVLDTSTGYGGRLLGAFASGVVGKYIGIDPNTKTHQANLQIIESLFLAGRCEFNLVNLPAEDVRLNSFEGQCDFAFTSPPYFNKEIYSEEETQSCNRYLSSDEWVQKFLKPMLRLIYVSLKPGAKAALNVAEFVTVKSEKKLIRFPLGEQTRLTGKSVGFIIKDELSFQLQSRFGEKNREVAFEPVIIFQKPLTNT